VSPLYPPPIEQYLIERLLSLYAKLKSEGWHVDASTVMLAVDRLNGDVLTPAQEDFLEERLRMREQCAKKA